MKDGWVGLTDKVDEVDINDTFQNDEIVKDDDAKDSNRGQKKESLSEVFLTTNGSSQWRNLPGSDVSLAKKELSPESKEFKLGNPVL